MHCQGRQIKEITIIDQIEEICIDIIIFSSKSIKTEK